MFTFIFTLKKKIVTFVCIGCAWPSDLLSLKKKKKVLFAVYVQVTLPPTLPPLSGEYLLTFYQRQNSDVHKRGRSPAW